MSNTTINERIKALMEGLKLNQRQFAMQCGVDPTVIYNIIGSRMNKPSFEVLQKILSSFTKINMQWFIHGDGEMFVNGNVIGNLNGNLNPDIVQEQQEEYKVMKPSEREKELEAQVQHLSGKVEALMAVIKELSVSNNAMGALKTGKKSA